MNTMHRIVGIVLVAWSALCFLSGINVAIATSGQVSGSEFGMLITIAHLLVLMLGWLAIWGAWRWSRPDPQRT